MIKNGRIIQCSKENYVSIVVPRLSTGPSSSTVSTSSTSASQDSVGNDSTTCRVNTRSRSERSGLQGDLLHDSSETENKHQNEEIDRALTSPMRDLPECSEDFTEHFVDEEASASSGQAQYFRTLPEGPTLRDLSEDKITRAPC